jgi:2-desacetyl-2-hydroxyethyl bacteriochlorophyllide A dehydrogenase
MKAAVFHGPQDVRFEEIDAPTLADGDVLLRVKACGICGSDLHTYKHGMFQQLGNPIEQGRVLGHEFSGEVIATGGPISGVSLGDRVTSIGVGANAEYLRIPKERVAMLLPIGDKISYAEAATTEPLATSLHAANLSNAQDNEIHLVVGAGIIGLGILQCIKASSNAQVIVADLSEKRLAKAAELGADRVIDVRSTPLVEALDGGSNFSEETLLDANIGTIDTVYDCAGMSKHFQGSSVLEQALTVVKENGKIVVVAVYEQSPNLDYNQIVRKGIQLMGSWAWSMEEFKIAADLIRMGEINRQPLISHEFSLEQASEAYETQLRAETAIKVMLTP